MRYKVLTCYAAGHTTKTSQQKGLEDVYKLYERERRLGIDPTCPNPKRQPRSQQEREQLLMEAYCAYKDESKSLH